MTTASKHAEKLKDLNDAAFLQQVRWSRSAPGQLREAAAAGDVLRFVLAYRAELEPAAARFRRRPECLPLSRLGNLTAPGPESLCSLVVHEYGQPGQRSTGPGRFGLGRAIANWLQTVQLNGIADQHDRAMSLELLLDPPVDLEASHWLRLWRLALAGREEVESQSATGSHQPSELQRFGEITLASALVLAPVAGTSKMLQRVQRWLSTELREATDTDGTPRATHIERFPEWFATLTRAGWWGRAFRAPTFVGDATTRFQDVVVRAVELSRGDGGLLFGPATQQPEIFSLAARIAGLSKKTPAGRFARSLAGERRKPKPVDIDWRPSGCSEWAEVASLRTRPARDADTVGVVFGSTVPRVEVVCLGTPILSGPWTTHVQISGRRAAMRGEWECTCWYSDEDGDYLELQLSERTFTLDRQLFLSRTDHFAILTDHCQSKSSSAIEYRTTIPLMPDVMSRADFVSREWRLQSGLVPVRVLPISLEYDRVHSSQGACEVRENELHLSVSGRRAVSSGAVLSWHPDRRDVETDWARLTVTESRQVLTRDQATACRVRIGPRRLFIYRSLDTPSGLRAAMGHHTGHESVIGRLNDEGRIEPLVLVDSAPPQS